MGKFTWVSWTLVVCLISLKSLGRMHSEEELAEFKKRYSNIQKTLDGFSKNLNGELRSKYSSLKNAMDAYASAHGYNETSSAGTGWADGVASGRKSVQIEFIDLFRNLESKQFKEQSELDFIRQDSELNRIYREIQNNKNLDSDVAAAVSRRGVKETQRKWIKYRDTWLAFATIEFPTVSQHSLNATLTADRVSRLKQIPKEQ